MDHAGFYRQWDKNPIETECRKKKRGFEQLPFFCLKYFLTLFVYLNRNRCTAKNDRRREQIYQ